MVGPERVVGRIQELVNTGKVPGISDVKNLSDRRSGLNITIECKPGVNAHALLTELYRLTPLEESYGINNVVLVNGIPTTVGLWDLCNLYAEHRLDVVRRRTQYRLTKAQDRLHIVEGLLIALDAIDTVIAIIRSSQDAAEARSRLCAELSLSELQATHILDMQLRRLTALEKIKLQEEAAGLRAAIEDYEKILASEQRQRTIVLKELEDLVEQFGHARRTRIISPDQLADVELEAILEEAARATDEPCAVALSASGVVGREPATGPKQATFGRHDVLRCRVQTTTMSKVAAITDAGRVLQAPAAAISEVTGRSRGDAAGEAFGTQKGEQILTLITGADPQAAVMLVTAGGVAKRVTTEEIMTTPNAKSIISVKPGDSLIAAFPLANGGEVIVVASNAQALRIEGDSVSVQGRGAGGVSGMKLSEGATVIAAGPANEDTVILTHTDRQTAKVTDAAEIPLKGRGTGGVRVTKFKDERRLDFAYVGPERGVSLIVGTEDAPSKPDPSPESLTIAHTARDLMSRPVPRRILGVGFGRW
jgi:DNA gyrase subunit A